MFKTTMLNTKSPWNKSAPTNCHDKRDPGIRSSQWDCERESRWSITEPQPVNWDENLKKESDSDFSILANRGMVYGGKRVPTL